MSKRFNRRDFLRMTTFTIASMAVSSCGTQEKATEPVEEAPVEEAPVEEATTAVEATTAPAPETSTVSPHQAPALQEKVEAGELPSLAERLPEEPLVIEPLEEIGVYGGDYVQGCLNPQDYVIARAVFYEPLVRWDPDWTKIIPGLATEWETPDDGMTWIFHLREGVKWSDGQPFTADDILFWYEEITNEDLYPSFPSKYSTKNGPLTVEKIDDYTVQFNFLDPNGLFPALLAQKFDGMVYKPAHYCKQFFPGYVDDEELSEKAKEVGADAWYEAYEQWTDPTQNADVPVVWAWKLTPTSADSTQVIFDRNPYYWKVDTEGNQLPYCDRLVNVLCGDRESIVMMAVAGEISYQYHHISELKNKPMYEENKEQGDFHVVDCTYPGMGDCILNFNLTHEDSVKRQVFQNKQFRIGISHAVNRQEMVDIAYMGVGTPWQAAPLPESSFHDEEMALQYTEYDPDTANEILDEVLPEKDSEGFRLGPDGEPFGIVCEIMSDRQAHIDSCNLIKDYLAEVGIRWENKVEDSRVIWDKLATGENNIDVWPFFGDAGLDYDIYLSPKNYFAVGINSFFAPLWGLWYSSDGAEGEEPPEPMKRQMEIYREVVSCADPDERHEQMEEILRIAKEEFWTVGTWRSGKFCAICKNNFKNVPDKHWVTWPYPDPGPFNPCTFFWKE